MAAALTLVSTRLHNIRMSTKIVQIALVDDHRLFRSGIVSLINNFSGYQILFEAGNGEELARKMSPKFKPDIILLDINMPVMDGFEASKRIRSLEIPRKGNIPIIAVTASVGAAIEQVKSYPFIDDCLLKPFRPEDLREKLIHIAANKKNPAIDPELY